jgi:indole-3-glycerol phosphate synthase
MLPAGVTAVAESGIKSGDDIRRLTAAGYSAFLVGEQLITQPDPGSALRVLRHVGPGSLDPGPTSGATPRRL